MYELIPITGNSYYIQSPSKMGLVRLNNTDVCLIDSGNDKDAGRKVRQLLDANGWHLSAIYNTHSNADHIGGRPGAEFTRRVLSAPSPAIRYWNPLFCTAAFRQRICATSS